MKMNGMLRAFRIAATGKHRASWSFTSSKAPSSPAFSGQSTSLRQPADRTDRLQAAVVQEIADQFGHQVAVFDDEDLLSVPAPAVTQAWRCFMHPRKRDPSIREGSPPLHHGPQAFPEPFSTQPRAATNFWST